MNKIEVVNLLEAKRKVRQNQSKAVVPQSVKIEDEEDKENEEEDIPSLEAENKIKLKLTKKFELEEISLNDIFNDPLSMFFDIKEVNCDRKKKILDLIVKVIN